MNPSDDNLWPQWRQAAARPTIDTALRELYGRLDAEVARRSPTCWISGRCCKFDQFGHRLYVTGLEVAWFLRQVEPRIAADAQTPGACPYQVGGLCTTHAVRPLGCRIFFCQQGTEAWQQELYERFLAELRALHDDHDLPYRYMDWLAALDQAAEGRLRRPR